MAPSVPALSARRLLARIEQAGASAADARSKLGWSDATTAGDARVPLAEQYRLWELAVDATGDRTLPLRIASTYDVSTYDVLGFACSTAPDLRAAYRRLARFMDLWVGGEWIELAGFDDAGDAVLIFHHALPASRGRDLAAESSLAKILVAGRRAAGCDITPLGVELAHRAPPDRSALETWFGAPITFAAGRYALRFDAQTLASPMLRADADIAAFFERHAASMLPDRREGEITRAVRRVAGAALSDGSVAEPSIARQLGLSPRTMRRRLADEGTTFSEVVDDERRQLSVRYLRETNLALAEIAMLVGFSDASNFHRAFKRWTGTTPGRYRSG